MLELIVWDVQHGSATYIKTPDGKHIVVDLGASGENGQLFSPLRTLRYWHGVQQLDAVVITHAHRDHLDDILNFMALSPSILYTPRHLTNREILAGNRTQDRDSIEYYLALRDLYSHPMSLEKQVERAESSAAAGFQVFCPTKASTKNLNDHSLVVVVSYAGLKIVIPGDNEPASWRELLDSPDFRMAIQNTDIPVASHHGRESGHCSDLFKAMIRAPKLVVISDGRFCDTSATSRYSNQASGWTVFDSVGASEKRYCVTTRNDGHITIKCGWSVGDPRFSNFLNVTVSNRIEPNWSSTLAALGYGAGPLRS